MADAAASGPITNRRVVGIAAPIVLSNATVPLVGIVDTGVIGQLGTAAPIGAVGLGSLVLTSVYWIFGFLRMGTVGLTSQAIGAANEAEADALLSRALMIGVAAGLALILLQGPFFGGVLWVSRGSAEVEALARDYMAVRILSAPAAIGVFGITGWLIAHERTRGVLAVQIWTNGVNMALSALFVLGLDWGVEGVALATVIAEWSGFALALWLCRAAFARPGWRDWPRVFDRVRLMRMAQVNTDILLRTLMLEAIFVSFMFYGTSLGDVTLAANQVLLQFLMFTAFALDGFAFSAEALVGSALGARRRAQLRRAAGLTSAWGAGTVVCLALAFALFGGAIIDLLTTAEDVRAAARGYLAWMVAAPILGCAAWMFDGIFIGATRTREMRNMMTVALAVYVAAVLVLVPLIGNHGLWAGLLLSFVTRGVTLGLKYPALEAGADAPPEAG
ncbi:MAG: MATE family efflux transporter [Paracoccaceae bacterium]|nr:MATE family efflux transporter [Paracoccaceae bacterium]